MSSNDAHARAASLRRQLDDEEAKAIPLLDETQDLSKVSRSELEAEVHKLREKLNQQRKSLLEQDQLIRDTLSHTTTGKNEEYLALNQTPPKKEERALGEILSDAGKRALGGGLPGAFAMSIQVFALMWLRTTMNYQYRHGTSTMTALRTLYSQGGIARFYQGLVPALAQGPLSRFGDTAANSGTLALLDSWDSTRTLPIAVKTMCASAVAAAWRINLMPIDTLKTILQVEGRKGWKELGSKIKTGGIPVLYHGAIAASAGTFVGHFPWFFTFNTLNEHLPRGRTMGEKLARNATIGFASSLVSDVVSNSVRVVKVAKQASPTPISYPTAVREIIAADGLQGLFFRGLGTRLIANGFQGLLFTVIWKAAEENFFNKHKEVKTDTNKATA